MEVIEKEVYENTAMETTENVISEDCANDLKYNQTINVRVPKPESKVLLDISTIDKVKNKCIDAQKTKFPYAELFLGLSSLFLGAFLGAIMSQITYELALLSILFYTVFPVLGIGFGVAYLFCRKNEVDDLKHFSKEIIECISSTTNNEGE